MMKRLSVICVVVSAFMAAPVIAATVIHAGKVIDGVSDQVQGPHTIVVEDGRIVSITSGHIAVQGDDQLIDLKDYTVLPGLMDMHTHLVATDGGPEGYLEPFTLSSADFVLKMQKNAQTTLMAGFTTVRDLGDAHNVSIALRNAINRGDVPGPHIFTSTAPIASTGGHGDPSNGIAAELGLAPPTAADGVINGPYDARKAVRQRYKISADLIKITATGGVMSLAKSAQNAQFTTDELAAIVATAKDYGFHVAAHAHGADGLWRAVEAGVSTIEHGTYLDARSMKRMKERGIYLVPTLMAGDWITKKAKLDNYLPEIVRPKAAAIGPLMAQTFARAYKAGVPIMFGTDSGVSSHGDNAQEFALMVAAGMPAMAAIKSATAVPARFLGVADKYGTLRSGLEADIIAAPGDPIEDISVLQRVNFVMIGGKIIKAPGS